jgi:hypothetical protein
MSSDLSNVNPAPAANAEQAVPAHAEQALTVAHAEIEAPAEHAQEVLQPAAAADAQEVPSKVADADEVPHKTVSAAELQAPQEPCDAALKVVDKEEQPRAAEQDVALTASLSPKASEASKEKPSASEKRKRSDSPEAAHPVEIPNEEGFLKDRNVWRESIIQGRFRQLPGSSLDSRSNKEVKYSPESLEYDHQPAKVLTAKDFAPQRSYTQPIPIHMPKPTPNDQQSWPCWVDFTRSDFRDGQPIFAYDFFDRHQAPYNLRAIFVHAGKPDAEREVERVASIRLRFQLMENQSRNIRDGLQKDGTPFFSEFSLSFPICQEYKVVSGKSAAIQNFRYRSVTNMKQSAIPRKLRYVLQAEHVNFQKGAVCVEWDCDAAVRGESDNYKKFHRHSSRVQASTPPAIKSCLQMFPKIAADGGHVRVFVYANDHDAMERWRKEGMARMYTLYKSLLAPEEHQEHDDEQTAPNLPTRSNQWASLSGGLLSRGGDFMFGHSFSGPSGEMEQEEAKQQGEGSAVKTVEEDTAPEASTAVRTEKEERESEAISKALGSGFSFAGFSFGASLDMGKSETTEAEVGEEGELEKGTIEEEGKGEVDEDEEAKFEEGEVEEGEIKE